VALRFANFELEDEYNCEYDFLDVVDQEPALILDDGSSGEGHSSEDEQENSVHNNNLVGSVGRRIGRFCGNKVSV